MAAPGEGEMCEREGSGRGLARGRDSGPGRGAEEGMGKLVGRKRPERVRSATRKGRGE